MKGVDIFCASQAATSICRSMEQISASSSPSTTTTLLGGGGGCRVIDRHNPIIKDSKRATSKPTPPPTSKLHPKKKNSRNVISSHQNENQPNKSSDLSLSSSSSSSLSKLDDDKAAQNTATLNDVSAGAAIAKRKSWSCTRPGDFLSPPGSTRYLLREKVYYNTVALSDSDPTKLESSNKDINSQDSTPSDLPQQVVVMRVSLHCRGCEKKLRKHLSRMEGVKSFDIDFLARKVTVTGNVMPSDVVSSISKVMKNAQLWSSSSNPIKSDDIDNVNNLVVT